MVKQSVDDIKLKSLLIGKVITENRNIFTTRPHPGYGLSTIGHLFSKPDAHMPDPYERKKELESVWWIIIGKYYNEIERKRGRKKKIARTAFLKKFS